MPERSDILVSPVELSSLLDGPTPVRVLDVRWRLDRPDGRADFEAGHIPGAVYVDLDRDLAAHGAPTDGRHPLPSRDAVQAAARAWGLRDGDPVVVYDDLASMSAARAWWVLRDAGLADVRILDGALGAWKAAALPLESGPVTPVPGDVVLTSGALPQLTIDEASVFPGDGVLLDVRAPERYRGDVEPIDPRAGHIPGARNLPTAGNVDADGRFLQAEALRERFAGVGVDDATALGLYCGSGVTASHAAVAATLAGFAPRLYAGSWSQWSNHPDRPAATGETPEGA